MTGEDRTVAIIGAVTTALPAVINLVQALFINQNPDEVPPTSAEVVSAWVAACTTTLAKDDAWLAMHPKT